MTHCGRMALALTLGWSLTAAPPVHAQAAEDAKLIRAGAKVFIAPMEAFENFPTAAIVQKAVPVLVVRERRQADFEVTGSADTRRGATATIAEATFTVTRISTGVVAFAYAVQSDASGEGRKSAAESCADKLKAKIEDDVRLIRPASASPSAPSISAAPAQPSAPPAPAPDTRRIRVRLQGDTGHDFIGELRSAFAAHGIELEIAQPSAPIDYSVILALQASGSSPSAAVIALDRDGNLVAAAVDSGFRARSAVSGAAKEIAKRITSLRQSDPNPKNRYTRKGEKRAICGLLDRPAPTGQGDAQDATQRPEQRRDHPRPAPGRGRRESHRGLSPTRRQRADASIAGRSSSPGSGSAELRELRSLRHENSKLKQVVADLTLDRHILQEIVRKKL